MEIKDCIKGRRCRITLSGDDQCHYATIDSVVDSMFGPEKLILVNVLGELKVVHPDNLEPLKKR